MLKVAQLVRAVLRCSLHHYYSQACLLLPGHTASLTRRRASLGLDPFPLAPAAPAHSPVTAGSHTFCFLLSGWPRTHSYKKYLSSSSSKPDAVPLWVSKVPNFVELDRKMPPLPHVQDPACFPGSLRIREVTWENLLLSTEEVRHRFPEKEGAPLPHSHCTHGETEACRCPVTLPDLRWVRGRNTGQRGLTSQNPFRPCTEPAQSISLVMGSGW